MFQSKVRGQCQKVKGQGHSVKSLLYAVTLTFDLDLISSKNAILYGNGYRFSDIKLGMAS